MNLILNCYTKNYFNFHGRAGRKEYWLFWLINSIISFLLVPLHPLLWIFAALTLLPSLGVAVRRLHDTNRSAWFLLLPLIPLIGGIWLIVLLCLKSNDRPNSYGELPPK